MPLDNTFPLRRGDVVSIRGTVKYDVGASDEYVHVQIHDSTIAVARMSIADLVAPHIDIGDRVWWHEGGRKHEGELVSVSGDYVWVKLGDGRPLTRSLSAIMPLRPPLAAKTEEEIVKPPPVPAPEPEIMF
jgi:hypothetical protein